MKKQRVIEIPAIPLESETRSVLRLSEAAKHLGCSLAAMRQRIKRGGHNLEAVQVGRAGLWFIKTDSLRKVLGVKIREVTP